MLEIPESKTLSNQLNETIAGKKIVKVMAGASPHGFAFYSGDPEDYPKMFEGLHIEESKALAGLVEVNVEGMCLLFGDGVNLRYFDQEKDIPKKHQLCIQFDDHTALACTVQMYGGMWAYPKGSNDNFYYLVTKEKPSPLSHDFDETYFDKLLRDTKPSISAKAFLATEQRIPGLGNGTLQDILFIARIHPKTKLEKLSDEMKKEMYDSVKNTLSIMAEKGGRDTERDLFGMPGGYLTILSKLTMQNPCPVCGSAIIRQAYLGGNVYYCPSCQPLIK